MRNLQSSFALNGEYSEAVHGAIRSAFCEFTVSAQRGGARFGVDIDGTLLNNIAIYLVRYDADVRVNPLVADDSLLLHLPVSGSSTVTIGSESYSTGQDKAFLLQHESRPTLFLEAGSQHIVMKARKASFQSWLKGQLGTRSNTPLYFHPIVDIRSPAIRLFAEMLGAAVRLITPGSECPQIAVNELEQFLIGQLILGQPNNLSEALRAANGLQVSRPILRAMHIIEDDYADALSCDGIARRVGLSVRGLQEGFRRYLCTTPMEYLREVRLRSAHSALKNANPASGSVTQIAFDCGFQHLGRFSASYRSRYNQSPSETLKRSHDGGDLGPVKRLH